jgi:hypothetical protein
MGGTGGGGGVDGAVVTCGVGLMLVLMGTVTERRLGETSRQCYGSLHRRLDGHAGHFVHTQSH